MPMPLLRSTLLSCALLAQVGAVQTTAPTTTPTTLPAAEVEALVRQLGGDDLAARDRAQAELLALDGDVLPALQAARRRAKDPDVQLRLDALLVQLQERIDLGASRITLKFVDAPLKDVVDALEAQSRGNFSDVGPEFGGDQMPRVTLDVRDASFWQAIRKVQEAANVVFVPQGNVWQVSRNFTQSPQAGGVEVGAFYVQPLSSSYTRSVGYARNSMNSEQFMFQLQAMMEPKIRLANTVGTLTLERCVDSNGNDLLAQQRVQSVSSGGQNTLQCGFRLQYPKNAGERIAELSGTLRFAMARRVETFASDDFLASPKLQRQIDNTRLSVESVPPDQNQPGWVGVVIVIQGAMDAATVQRMQASVQQVRITDAQGQPLQLKSPPNQQVAADRFEQRMTYGPMNPAQASSGPYKLRLDVPTSFRDVEVPFTLKDLKMP